MIKVLLIGVFVRLCVCNILILIFNIKIRIKRWLCETCKGCLCGRAQELRSLCCSSRGMVKPKRAWVSCLGTHPRLLYFG